MMIDEASKNLRIYGLQGLLKGQFEMKAQSWLKKKLTDIVRVKAKSPSVMIDGVLVSDKVGEVKYLNMDRILSEGIKQHVV